jgi:hypothetical protein
MRDLSDVCGARNTQFEQEFFGLFRAETVSAHDWGDRMGDFCVADYLAELDKVHVRRYSTRFSLHLRRTSSCPAKTLCITLRLPTEGLSLPFGSQWATTHVRTAIDRTRRVFWGGNGNGNLQRDTTNSCPFIARKEIVLNPLLRNTNFFQSFIH